MSKKQTAQATRREDRIGNDPVFGYRALPGIADEMLDTQGNVRPVWQHFLASIGRMDETELANRFARADRYLRDAGVFYRAYGTKENSERNWPLSHVPVLIDDTEWQAVSKGLVQRAELLERIAADIYGPNRLVAEGFLPPSLVASNPEFLRPMVGVLPADGHFLHFCSFEIGRGPDGNWWVLSDRTEAPSGAGFALENRVATTRAFSDLYAETHVHRLAGFFGAFRDELQSRKKHPDDRIAVLTPGVANETYFEHAYIARYLGFMLLEGEDLTVIDGRVMVRTVAGLKPVGVLWRRLDAAFADPLELNQSSHIGTPGIVEALRSGSVSIVNSLGSGILETRAFLAFMPTICRRLLGQDPVLPSIATWWCGQQPERDQVAGNIEKMVIGPAYSTRPFFDDNGQSVLGSSLRDTAKTSVAEWLQTDGPKLVRTGSRHPVHHARLDQRQADAAADEPARLCGPHPRWLAGHAGRFCPYRLRRRCRRDRHAGGRFGCRCLDRQPEARRADDAAAGRGKLHPHHARQPAEPGGRQPVLAWPLYRARRRGSAHSARLARALCRNSRYRNAAVEGYYRLSGRGWISTPSSRCPTA